MLVDDHPVVRKGLLAVLSTENIEVVSSVGSGEEALSKASSVNPDVVLCDLRLGEGIDGIDTTAALRLLKTPPAVIILSTHNRDAEILASIKAGASGYVLKDSEPEQIISAIHAASEGKTFFSPKIAEKVFNGLSNPLPKLTARETEVLGLIAGGSGNKEIAEKLHLSEATVKSHVSHIITKLNADNRSRAISKAIALGLI
ncbi:MAG: response regulator transcription factor [Aurantimicrobium sp.]|uniref:response regulator transcription factor n=1 Tax=Aurantimicrobium sp. TaxID=1930784 RepID=UPI002FC9022A